MKKFKSKLNKAFISTLIIIFLIIPQFGCAGKTENPEYSKTTFCFDTICEITAYGISEDRIQDGETCEDAFNRVITEAFSECGRLQNILSKTVGDSDIDRINRAEGETVKVEELTLDIIEKGLRYCDLSNGAFDITIGRCSKLWDFHEAGEAASESGNEGSKLPDESELSEAAKHVDYTQIAIDRTAQTVSLGDPEMEIDLGGIAKGYIADYIADYIAERGICSAVVNLGGNIVTVGGKTAEQTADITENAEETPFRLGVKNPLSESGELLGIIEANDITLVTSGTYERYFEYDGKKYHHILNPDTGYPVDTDVLQVTIMGPRGMSCDCDGLSTVCLSLGVEKGVSLIKNLAQTEEYEGIEAIFLDLDGNVTVTNPETVFEPTK